MKGLGTLFILMAVAASVRAGTTGKIVGEVKDAQSGEALIGATIVVEGTSLGAAANIEGYFVILNVPPGKYTITAASVGYTKKSVSNVDVQVDLTSKVNFELNQTVLEVGEEVVVTADRQMVRKDLTSSEARVNSEEIKTLPVSEVSEVISLQSGVTLGSDGAIHIRGGRTNEVAYWVDGVSISDAYDGGQAVQVDNNSVQELQVISGTFNAEYGQAMSGIINIVTKDGDQEYHGSLMGYVGDYASSDGWTYDGRPIVVDGSEPVNWTPSETFYNLNDLDPAANKNLEGSLSGPIPGVKDITFYLAGRYFQSDGWLYGQHVFNPDGSVDLAAVGEVLEYVEVPVSDTSTILVPRTIALADNPYRMNNRERISGQAKLTFQLTGSMKFSLSGLGSSIEYRDYDHNRFLAPVGDVTKYDKGYNLSGLWTHTLGSSSFYTVNLSFFHKGFREYLYENPLDPRYITAPNFTNVQNYEWLSGGTSLHQFKRNTDTRSVKLDYTDQVSKLHQVKLGADLKLHTLYLEDYNVTFDEAVLQETGQYVPIIPPRDGPLYQEYTREPVEFSVYIQDKLEYDNMIVNIGVRYDYFDPKGQVLADPADPNVYLPRKIENQWHDDNMNGIEDPGENGLEERRAYWYKDASVKTNISPRLGISYPITDQGILHFSYGHFLQIPSFQYLYQQPEYKVTTASGIQGVYGNPDLDVQTTYLYEFGLQQQVMDELGFDMTLFYRDTRDWVTTSAPIAVGDPGSSTSSYTMFINRDYANTRGLTLTVDKRPANMWSFNLSYTFQIAEGINSNPDDELAAQQNNAEPARALTPLDWDQTHTLNATLGFGETDWGAYVVSRYGSGLPYTPTINQAEAQGADVARIVTNNSRRRPSTLNFDLRLFKNFTLAPFNFSVFLKVFNLLDRRNEVTVYGETGRATATVRSLGVGDVTGAGRLNPIESYIIRPDYYSEPREIQLGVELTF